MNKQYSKDESAQVGIGTMIVFIATILVAAVAAGVLIDTSQKLQSKSTQTGNAAVEMVGNAMQFQTVVGYVSGGTAIDRLEIWIELAAGSDPIDLEQLVIQYKTNDATTTYVHTHASNPTFQVFDSDGTTPSTEEVIESGELHKIEIGVFSDASGGTALGLGKSKDVTLELIPEIGVQTVASFETPSTFKSGDNYIELF